MSFSFNENLVLEENQEAFRLLEETDKQRIEYTIREVALKEITLQGLKEEFLHPVMNIDQKVIGEHIKGYFVIALNGITKVLTELSKENSYLKPYATGPLYENVFSYIDNILDEMDFDELFKRELTILNQ